MGGRTLLRRAVVSSVAGGTVLGLLTLALPSAPAPAASTSVPAVSGNWAGYVAAPSSGSGVTAVSGSWTVPPAGTLPPGLSSDWVGIGGFNSTDLIQTGTQQTSPPLDQLLGSPTYSAWYELLPGPQITFGGPVGPGDHMTASIVSNGANSWTINLADAGRWSASKTVSYQSSESSAEWIHESTSLEFSVGGVGLPPVPIPMGGSGTVTFDHGGAVIGGSTRTIASSGAIQVIALPVESAVSGLDSDNDGFNVCTYAVLCSPPSS